jgi:trypsin
MKTRSINNHLFGVIVIATIVPVNTSNAESVTHEFVRPEIVGGEQVPKGRYQFMVYMEVTDNNGDTSTCGGSLIDANSVLTAAHCVADKQPAGGFIAYPSSNVKAWVKAWDTNNLEDAKERQIKSIYVHDKYNNGIAYGAYDVAVLTLNKRVLGIPNLDLPRANKNARIDAPDVKATVAGWGDTTEGGSSSTILKKLKYEIVDDDLCKNNYATMNDKVDASIQLCAYTSSEGFCNGDSGGPLFRHIEGNDVQIGIVSWSEGCARENLPDVYVRLTDPNINGFIKRSMKK